MTYLHPAINAALPMLRAEAEARMTSRCTIRHKTGEMVLDPENQEVPEWVVAHANLPCRIATSTGAARSRTQTPGDVELERATPELHVPAAIADLSDDDFAEITLGENVGRVFRILEVDWVDQATARRLPVEAVERPIEWGA